MGKTVKGSDGGMLSGDSHDAPSGGIKTKVVGSDQILLTEGGEAIINKTSLASDKQYTVTGTPKEIASAVNSVDGNGVAFEKGAELTDHQTGETKIMEQGGYIPQDYFEYLWWLLL